MTELAGWTSLLVKSKVWQNAAGTSDGGPLGSLPVLRSVAGSALVSLAKESDEKRRRELSSNVIFF